MPQIQWWNLAVDWMKIGECHSEVCRASSCPFSNCFCTWLAQPRLKDRIAAAKATAKKPCQGSKLNHPKGPNGHLSLSISIAIPNAHVINPKALYIFEKIHNSVEIETHYIISGWAPNEVRRADCNRTTPEVSRLNWWPGCPMLSPHMFLRKAVSQHCMFMLIFSLAA